MSQTLDAPASAHPYDAAVFIGRFAPFHIGHLGVVESALSEARHLIVLIGSSNQARSPRNPFTFGEREEMIRGCLSHDANARVSILPVMDRPYSNTRWVTEVQDIVADELERLGLDAGARITLIGHAKDKSSYYLNQFPQWGSTAARSEPGVNATGIRSTYFRSEAPPVKTPVPASVATFLARFARTPNWAAITAELDHIRDYQKPYEGLPYKPIFSTVDAVVVQAGHVLLVKRKARPGKGLWALPGGFIDHDEWIEDALFRELREETGIKVPQPVLRGSIQAQRTFDDPYRSWRGRTITHAFLIKLQATGLLPKVKGGDDAARAVWMPIGRLDPAQMFEDHYAIIDTMVQGLVD